MRVLLLFCTILFFNQVQGQDPDPPTITHLSVDSLTQQVELYWYNNAPTAVGYIIYFQDAAGLWIPLDTVNGQQNLSYTTQGSNFNFRWKLIVLLLLMVWVIVAQGVRHIQHFI